MSDGYGWTIAIIVFWIIVAIVGYIVRWAIVQNATERGVEAAIEADRQRQWHQYWQYQQFQQYQHNRRMNDLTMESYRQSIEHAKQGKEFHKNGMFGKALIEYQKADAHYPWDGYKEKIRTIEEHMAMKNREQEPTKFREESLSFYDGILEELDDDFFGFDNIK